jgi:hypothetical protein
MEGISFQGVAAKHIIAMQSSTEALVALAVAAVFVLLTLGAIAREQGQEPASRGQNAYIATNNGNLRPVAASGTEVLGFY